MQHANEDTTEKDLGQQVEEPNGEHETKSQEEEKPSYSKFIVALMFVTIIAYTSICFFFLWNGKPLNDVLTTFFFSCFGLEFASLAFIKGRKIGKLKWVASAGDKKPGHVEVVEDNEKGDKNEQRQ